MSSCSADDLVAVPPRLIASSAMESPVLLSISQTCEITGLGRTKLYEEIRTGRLRSVKVGARRLVPRVAIDEWISGLPSDH